MVPIKVLIADDEIPARNILKLLLRKFPDVEIIGECASGKEVLRFLSVHPGTELLFLDIEMPGMNGLETAAKIKNEAPDVKLAFATGFSQFAVRAFELEAFDYLLKPYSHTRLEKTIGRFRALRMERRKSAAGEILAADARFLLRTADKTLALIPKEEIVFVNSEKSGLTRFYTTHGIINSKIPLRDAEDRLAGSSFFRTHRCFLVNLQMIDSINPGFNDTFCLSLRHYEGEAVPVSRHYMKAFKMVLGLQK